MRPLGDRRPRISRTAMRPATSKPDEEETALIIFTSGTSGEPKAVVLSHRAVLARLQMTLHVTRKLPHQVDESARDVTLLTGPLFHVGSMQTLLRAVIVGDTLVLSRGRYDPADVLDLIERHKVNRWNAVPTMVSRLLDHPDVPRRDLSSLKSISIGGAPVHAELMQRIRTELPSVSPRIPTGYGLTENGGQATAAAGSENVELLGSTGRPLPCVEVRFLVASRPARRRDPAALADADDRLLRPRPVAHRQGRLAAHRRSRPPGRQGQPVDHRPLQGHDHPRRREHRAGGGRARADDDPRRERGRRVRRAARRPRRGSDGGRGGRRRPHGAAAAGAAAREGRLVRRAEPLAPAEGAAADQPRRQGGQGRDQRAGPRRARRSSKRSTRLEHGHDLVPAHHAAAAAVPRARQPGAARARARSREQQAGGDLLRRIAGARGHAARCRAQRDGRPMRRRVHGRARAQPGAVGRRGSRGAEAAAGGCRDRRRRRLGDRHRARREHPRGGRPRRARALHDARTRRAG